MRHPRPIRLALPSTLLALAFLGGCASAPLKTTDPRIAAPAGQARATGDLPASPTHTVRALLAQHEEWAGTPYRHGGTSRRGIDCSGFVQTTYATRLGQTLPRSTEAQARVGRPVRRAEMIAGDLVFFRTGRKTRHVGIYVGDGHFLHASTSQGVTLSRLDNPYWASTYWIARRP